MLTLKAPAKINWFLRVLLKRPDGYHDIESLMQCVSLFDTLSFEMSDTLELLCNAAIPIEENIVYKAATALKDASGFGRGARISLEKNIPLEAGMGGGSSDAACTLVGLNQLWGLGLPQSELIAIAGRLGSDVSFFLNGPSAIVSGRGERAKPVSIRKSHAVLLLKPEFGVSAGWAYGHLAGFNVPEAQMDGIISALNEGDYGALSKMLVNDLEGPVVGRHPEIRTLKERAIEEGAVLSLMSGSGSTVFSLFEDSERAESARSAIGAHWSAVVSTIV